MKTAEEDTGATAFSETLLIIVLILCFYEKVTKLKADVATFRNFLFSDIVRTSRVAWRGVKGAVFWRSS